MGARESVETELVSGDSQNCASGGKTTETWSKWNKMATKSLCLVRNLKERLKTALQRDDVVSGKEML